ncbi:sigma factor [Streptomyces sp. NPDC054866]
MTDVPADGPVTTPATAAYSRIYEEEQPRLVAYARSLTGSAWVADDLVAEAHFRVWRRLSSGHEIENVPAYLMTTVRHLAAAVGRDAGRETPRDPHAPETVEPFGVVAGGVVAGGGEDPGDRVSSVDLLGRVLGQLPERWVKALWLAEAEGQPLETVGRRIGAGRGATAVLLHRAREGMRQAFLRAHPGTPEDPACEQHWDRIPGHIRGEASARQSEQLLAHLDGCADCRGRLALLARANDRLPALVGPALLIFALGGTGKFLLPLAAGSAGSAGAASGSGGHGGFLHGVRHVLTGGGKVPAAVVGVVGASVAGAAVAAGLVLGGPDPAAPPQRATAVESGAPERAPSSAASTAPVPERRGEGAGAGSGPASAPASASASAEVPLVQEPSTEEAAAEETPPVQEPPAEEAPAPEPPAQDPPGEEEAPPEQEPAVGEAPAQPVAPAPEPSAPAERPEGEAPSEPAESVEPVTPAEPTEPVVPPVEPTEPATPVPTPTSIPTPTPTPPPTPAPVGPTPVEPTPVEPTPPPSPVCEPWVGPIHICHSP